ncbi:MAG: hypothetical protein ACYS9X_16855 [Planctomycetota bacterium]
MSGNSAAVVALDLHKKFTRAVTMGPRGEVMDDRRISHIDHAEMERFFREFEQETDISMEATFPAGRAFRQLAVGRGPRREGGPEAPPRRPPDGPHGRRGPDLRATRIKDFTKGLPKSGRPEGPNIRRSRPSGKDCIAEGTLWLRRMFPEAYRAPRDVRRRRGLLRMRGLFVRMRTALKCNVHPKAGRCAAGSSSGWAYSWRRSRASSR